jgi:tetratricopeptide (TPR) repeat protein
MTRQLFPLALSLTLLVAVKVAGQSPQQTDPNGSEPSRLDSQPRTAEAAQRDQVYEDIEVLRRLLNRGLAQSYGSAALGHHVETQDRDLLALQWWAMRTRLPGEKYGSSRSTRLPQDPHAALTLAAPEGVYFKGKGVVYSVTLPAPNTDPVKGTGMNVSRPLTEWDRVRQEVRGEKPTEPKKPVGQPALTDAVLKVLADNGKHLHLAPQETVTVVITFRGTALTCTSCHRDPFGEEESGTEAYQAVTTYQPTTTYRLVDGHPVADVSYQPVTQFVRRQLSVSQGPKFEQPSTEDQPTETQNFISVGDLHYRQGNYSQAVKAYGQAIELQQKALTARGPSENWTVDDAKTLLLLSELNGKQARAQLALKDSTAARRCMQRAAELAREAEQLSSRTGPVKPTPSVLPAKLIITVSKKNLDLIGNEMMRWEDFRKEASVEYLTFPK